MENDYFLSHTFDQFDDFLNGRPIRPYDTDKLKSNSYSNSNTYSNNRFRNNYDYENAKNKMNLTNEQTHYEPYFSKATSRNQNKIYSPATSTQSYYGNSQSDFNIPIIRSISQHSNYLPVIPNGVPNSVRYVPSDVIPSNVVAAAAVVPTAVHPQPIVQTTIVPMTSNQIHTSYQPIQQPQLISTISPRYVTKPPPIINTFTYQPLKLPPINRSKRFIKYTNPVKFVRRQQAPF